LSLIFKGIFLPKHFTIKIHNFCSRFQSVFTSLPTWIRYLSTKNGLSKLISVSRIHAEKKKRTNCDDGVRSSHCTYVITYVGCYSEGSFLYGKQYAMPAKLAPTHMHVGIRYLPRVKTPSRFIESA
jgi:hypothetical protein